MKTDLCYLQNNKQYIYEYDDENKKIVVMDKEKTILKYMEIKEFKEFLKNEILTDERNDGRVTSVGFKILNGKII